MNKRLNKDVIDKSVQCKICNLSHKRISKISKICDPCWQKQKYKEAPLSICSFCNKNRKLKINIPNTCHYCYVKNNKVAYKKLLLKNAERSKTKEGLFTSAKSSAKERKIPWKIKEEDYFKLRESPCFYCGSPLPKLGVGLDRINNDKKIGYTIENVIPCCAVCNSVRGDKLSVTETIAAMISVKESRKESIENLYERNFHVDTRTIWICGEINQELAKNVIKGMDLMERINPHATIRINVMSEGGDWYAGLAIYEKIKSSPCPTHAIGMGQIGSTATAIFQAASVREIGQLAHFVIHNGSDGFEGDCKSFESWGEFSKKNRALLYNIYAEKSKKEIEFWESMCQKDTILSSQEVVSLGLADFVSLNKRKETLADEAEQHPETEGN